MKKLRLAALLFAVVLCLQSCGVIVINDLNGGGTSSPSDTDTDRSSDTHEVKEIIIDKKTSDDMKKKADETLSALSLQKYSGLRVFIASTDTLFFEGDGSPTPLTNDRVIRVEKISSKLDADVKINKYTEDELYEKLRSAVNKKEYFADVIAVPTRLVGKLAADGLIKSLRTVPDFDLGAEYFDAGSIQAFSGGHMTYALSGDGCFEPEKLYCVYFNKDMAKQLGFDMYSLLSNGQWTLEKYAECVSAAQAAGKETASVKSLDPYKRMLLCGSGFRFADSGTDKIPSANTFTEEYKNKVRLLSSLPEASKASSPDSFLAGGSLFYIDTVYAAETMADSSLVWGMLPFPKYGEAYENGAYVSDGATVLCIPEYVPDERLSGDLIEAFCAASSGYIKYDYLYHNMLDVLRDNGSVNSLNTIMNNPNYDFVRTMKTGYPTLYANTAGAFDELVSGELSFSDYASREAEVKEYMEKWFPVKYR